MSKKEEAMSGGFTVKPQPKDGDNPNDGKGQAKNPTGHALILKREIGSLLPRFSKVARRNVIVLEEENTIRSNYLPLPKECPTFADNFQALVGGFLRHSGEKRGVPVEF
ncbi:hypothetical protein ABVT39_026269 [Epinephelus coioides]